MQITITDKTRKIIACVLIGIKNVSLFVGIMSAMFGACGLDAESPYDKNAVIVCAIGLLLVVCGMLLEAFIIKFLIHDDEYITTVFNFDWYGNKCKANYLESKKGVFKRW